MPQTDTKQGLGKDIADQLLNKIMSDIESRAKAEAKAQAKSVIEAAEARARSAEEAVSVQREELARMREEMAQIRKGQTDFAELERQLRMKIDSMREGYEEQLREAQTVASTQKQMLGELERENASIRGRLEQASKAPAKQIVQMPAQPIPSFEVIPQKDGQGNLIGATVKPIGGN